jgi:hypothetical protein
MAHLGAILTALVALLYALDRIGVFDSMRESREQKRDQRQQRKRRQPAPKTYDHEWDDE